MPHLPVTRCAPGGWQPPPVERARSERTRPVDPAAPLSRISLELARQCNLHCAFCYTEATAGSRPGLSDTEIRSVIDEAVECGATLVSIVAGGEPLLRRTVLVDRESCIDYANDLGCYCVLYTNATLLDSRAARWLERRDVTVVGKLLSLREAVEDELVGAAGASRRMRRGIQALLDAGLADETPSRLALETVICRQNYDDLPDVWRWMRRRNIVPEMEIPSVHGRAATHRKRLLFDGAEAPDKYRQLFEELLRIDRDEFGFDWIPHPPFVASSCQLYYCNCYITDQGVVQPCASVDREYGVLRVGPRRAEGLPLQTIVTSPEFRMLRHIHEHLTGACRQCDLAYTCYGCRAAAWHSCQDLFAEDPTCWRRPAPVGSTRSLS
ncbi:MAG: radical SAM protein [Polyangiaceae bacterium]|nr:radical SAM protein [Polyangiaceae bacterium]